MAGQIRFYTDENVSGAVINGLRRQGADVYRRPTRACWAQGRMKNTSRWPEVSDGYSSRMTEIFSG